MGESTENRKNRQYFGRKITAEHEKKKLFWKKVK